MKATRRHESNLVAKKVGPWVRRGKNAILEELYVWMVSFAHRGKTFWTKVAQTAHWLMLRCAFCHNIGLILLWPDFRSRSTTVVPQ